MSCDSHVTSHSAHEDGHALNGSFLLVPFQAQQYMAMTRREKVQIRSKLLLERWKFYLKVHPIGVSPACGPHKLERNSLFCPWGCAKYLCFAQAKLTNMVHVVILLLVVCQCVCCCGHCIVLFGGHICRLSITMLLAACRPRECMLWRWSLSTWKR